MAHVAKVQIENINVILKSYQEYKTFWFILY